LLFSMFINDICKEVDISYILYAEDLVIYASDVCIDVVKDKLQKNISKIDQWCVSNFAKMNYSKRELMVFHKTQEKSNMNVELKVKDQYINRVFEFKYLGVRLDPTLSFKSQYNYVVDKTGSKLSFMYGIKRLISTNVMKIMLSSYIHSVADYCIEVWAVQSENMLQIIQSKIDRFLVSFFVPIVCKKIKRYNRKFGFKRIKHGINVCEIRKSCNLFTIQERRDVFLGVRSTSI